MHTQQAPSAGPGQARPAAGPPDNDGGDTTADRIGRILENSINEIYVFDAATLRLDLVNRRGRENLGYSPDELQQLTPGDILADPERPALDALLQALRSGEAPQTGIRTRHRRRDGSVYPVELHLHYLDLPPGPVFVAICLDLSREEQIESTLEVAETRLDTLLDSARQFIYLLDMDGNILTTNRHTLEQSGYTHEEMQGRPVHDFFTDESRQRCEQEFSILRHRGRNRAEMDFACKDGRILQMDCLGATIRDTAGNTTSFLIILSDITEQRRASAALMNSERCLDSIIENIPDMVFIKDASELRFVRVNRAAEKLLGYSREQLIGRNDYDFFPREQAEHFTRMDRKALASGEAVDIRQEEVSTAEHGRRLLHTRKVPVLDEAGRPAYLMGLSEDITDRVGAQQALQESERRFRAIFNSTFQFIGLLSPDGILLEANRTALDFIGRSNSDVVGRYFWDTDWWRHSATARDQLKDAVSRAAKGEMIRYETVHISKDNVPATIDFSLKPVTDETGRVILIIPEGRDITDRILAEEESRRYQRKMAHTMRINTMGEMAATMAHELNQPLTALISYCGTAETLLAGMAGSPPEILDILKRAREQAHRAGEIINQMRHYIRDDAPQKAPLEIDRLIVSISHLLEWDLGHSGIDLSFELDCTGRAVHAERLQIEQVLINLIRNSIDAIRDTAGKKGNITLQSRVKDDTMLEVGVIDSGPGIDASMIDNLFMPYQTNKGKGMGLGLAISRSIIEKHGGKLYYDTGPEEQHAFRFTLPLAGHGARDEARTT